MTSNNVTTFIIGAAASAEFDFPISKDLVKRILLCLEHVAGKLLYEYGHGLYNDKNGLPHFRFVDSNKDAEILYTCIKYLSLARDSQGKPTNNIDRKILQEYLNAAKSIKNKLEPLTTTIDEYLGRSDIPEIEITISKIAITAIIRYYEYNSILYEDLNKKISYQLDKLQSSYLVNIYRIIGRSEPEKILENKNFIIFNYDHCVEQLFYKYIQKNHGKNAIDSYNLLKNSNIVHPYGTANNFTIQNNGDSSFGDININFNNCSEFIEHAKVNIGLHTDLNIKSDKKIEIEKMLFEAKSVFIIGFGYHPDNLKILAPSQVYSQIPNRKVIANIFGLSETNARSKKDKLGSIANGADIFPIDTHILRDKEYRASDLINEYSSLIE